MKLPPPGSNRPAVVTGASSGIGREFVRLLARRGYDVVPVARRGDALEELRQELDDVGSVRPVAADLTTQTGRDRLDTELAAAAIVVNCAGTGPVGRVRPSQRTAELACVELNVAATVDLTSRAVAGMRERGSGGVLNVASTAAFMAVPGQAVYSASKAFVLNYTYALRAELRGSGVIASVLCPGPVRTDFAAANGSSDDRLFAGLPRRMILSPAEVAAAGYDGLARDRAVVVPGLTNTAMAALADYLPRRLVTPLVAANAPGLKA